MLRNICNCPNPPGGHVVCAPYQIAICRVINGNVFGECIDPPTEDLSFKELLEWLSEIITNKPTRLDDRQEEKKIINMLLSGKFRDIEHETIVNFKLPQKIKELIRNNDETTGQV